MNLHSESMGIITYLSLDLPNNLNSEEPKAANLG